MSYWIWGVLQVSKHYKELEKKRIRNKKNWKKRKGMNQEKSKNEQDEKNKEKKENHIQCHEGLNNGRRTRLRGMGA